ncbi:MAG: Asp-tRNA(Asn)/Glu-tRNA(Gln) amidotransferase subunit GatA [Ruminococcaceae bacterium]|nr:Asp-tRNA(Asn)/Glu-tRNA(Gln) amidotransferase subunit GatA [Oscillospiraceae bacterium]
MRFIDKSMSVSELIKGLNSKEFSSVEITKEYLTKIREIDKDLNAFITVTEETALKTAEQSDKSRNTNNDLPKLSGVPFGIKDNICTKEIKTTCASAFLQDFIPSYDAFVSETLKNLNAPLLGKLNLDEFGMGSTTENSFFGATKNPYDYSKTAGGSSGGSAAAVASGEVPFALGSDTGGSVRQPAAFCGVVGMKPTYGRISRNGLIAFASSLDHIGILSKTVYDNALILSELATHDKNDATCLNLPKENFTETIFEGVKGLKIGIPKEFFGEGLDSEIRESVILATKVLEEAGAELVEISIPHLNNAIHAYYIISSAEASSNLARFDGIRFGKRAEKFSDITELYKNSRSEGFGKEVKRRIMTGTYVLSEGQKDKYYEKALKVCENIKCEFESIFTKADIILTPTTPTAAFDLNKKNSPVQMYLNDIFTVPANLAGLPAISVPCGKTQKGLPIGVQFIGKKLDEKTLYKTAFSLEQEIKF